MKEIFWCFYLLKFGLKVFRKEKKLSSFPTPLQFLNFNFKVSTSKLLPSPSRYINRSGEQLPLRHMLIFRLTVDILAKSILKRAYSLKAII